MSLKRRDFNKALLAAVGGIVAGTTMGCKGKEEAGAENSPSSKPSADGAAKKSPWEMGLEKHACKTRNSCKGKGGCKAGDAGCAGKNTCKGKGGCATVKPHSCKGQNTCKGLGGCGSGDNGCKGKNSCKGKGGCGVPITH